MISQFCCLPDKSDEFRATSQMSLGNLQMDPAGTLCSACISVLYRW